MLCWFALRFALLFILLASPWPGLRHVFGACFREQARWLVAIALPQQSFRVESLSDPRFPNLDTVLVVADQTNLPPNNSRPPVEIVFDSSSQGWIPLALLTALCIATPLPWFKRLKALLAGAVVIEIIVAVSILVTVSVGLTSATSPSASSILLEFANHLLGENIWFSFVPSLILWALWLAWGGHWVELGKRLGASAQVRIHKA
jgi:hypothetical protein